MMRTRTIAAFIVLTLIAIAAVPATAGSIPPAAAHEPGRLD